MPSFTEEYGKIFWVVFLRLATLNRDEIVNGKLFPRMRCSRRLISASLATFAMQTLMFCLFTELFKINFYSYTCHFA